MFLGKLVAGLLGLFVAGIPGGFFGLVLGHLFDRGLASAMGMGGAGSAAVREAFFRTTFLLMGFIAKADGRVSEEEVAHTEALFQQLGLSDEQRHQAILLFKEGSAESYDPQLAVSTFLQGSGGHKMLKRTLIMFLAALAFADSELHQAEHNAMLQVGELLGYSRAEVDAFLQMTSAQAQFHSGDRAEGFSRRRAHEQHQRYARDEPRGSLSDAYAALGVDKSAPDKVVKRAYRQLMSQNHPDKLSARGVPEEMLRLATEKSQEIQGAYELIRKSRGSIR